MKRCTHLSESSYRTLGWPKLKPSAEGLIFWHIVNFTEHMPKEKTVQAFEDAFSIWQIAFDEIKPEGRVIEFQSTSDFDKADIKIYFVKPGRSKQVIKCADGNTRTVKIPSKLDGAGGVLAYVPYGSHEMFFDEGEKWAEMTNMRHGEIRLIDVALHEMGHLFDLGHSEAKNALMGAYFDGTTKVITQDDLDGVQVVWGSVKRALAKGVMNMLQTRPLTASHQIVLGMLEYYGMKEEPGPASNTNLLDILRQYLGWASDDSTLSWCSILLDHVAKTHNIERPHSPAAVDWKKVGSEIDPDEMEMGDVLVFYRDQEKNWQGHVGVFISHSERDGYIWLLGGNQSNQVNIQHQSLKKLRKGGVRRLNYL